jgi:hypothetical protein
MEDKDKFREFKDTLENWAVMWDKAQEEGVFKDAPKPACPSSQTASGSFFGLVNNSPTEDVSDADAKYWNDLQQATEQVPITEGSADNGERMGIAKAIAQAPNPIRQGTTGPDQEPISNSMGVTFTPEDIVELEELKDDLHNLKDKLNSLEGLGKSNANLDVQITELKKKIDEFSDALDKGHEVAPQGD